MTAPATLKKYGAIMNVPGHEWSDREYLNPLGFWQRKCRMCGVAQYLSPRTGSWSEPSSNGCEGYYR